jgi:glycerate kinase
LRVLICPDRFAGMLTSAEAAEAIATGWASVAPEHDLVRRPLTDGGPGFVDALDRALVGKRVTVATVDPLGRGVDAEILVVDDTAYLESAHACGLHLLGAAERDPRVTSSYGLGTLVTAALDLGASEIVIGLGGSATNDAGAGMLAALGLIPVDADGLPLPAGGAELARCAGIEPAAALRRVRLIGATDVDAPLTGIFGASAVFGPAKGATREDVLELDAALGHFASVLSDSLPTSPSDLAARPGAGAEGGLGAAILALGGELRSGLGLVRELTGLDAALDSADVVVTGEGAVDAFSLRGKVLATVAGGCRDRGLPCLVLAGQSSAGRRESAAAGVTDTYTLVEHFEGDLSRALAQPAAGLVALGARLAQQYRT